MQTQSSLQNAVLNRSRRMDNVQKSILKKQVSASWNYAARYSLAAYSLLASLSSYI
jgi:hypothetical protein